MQKLIDKPIYIKEISLIFIRPFRNADTPNLRMPLVFSCIFALMINFYFWISTARKYTGCLQSPSMNITPWNFTLEGEVRKGKLSSKGLYASQLFYGPCYFPKLSYVRKIMKIVIK